MGAFVLVHGAWQGASTWDRVTSPLRAAGHKVVTPTLSGMGIRLRELGPEVDVDTHIRDVLGALEYEDLRQVILVGHSYAGMVITSVAEKAAERIQRLVYVDAFIPNDGEAAMGFLPEPFQQAFRELAEAQGDGWRLPASERMLDIWGLKEGGHRDFVRSRLCDFTIKCFERPVSLPENVAATLDRTYFASVRDGYPGREVFKPFGERAKKEGWRYHELPTGHDCHVEEAEEFSRLLLALA